MTRDKQLYGRAMHLLEVNSRRHRMGKIDSFEHHTRLNRIARAHYRAQRATGAGDYQHNI